jgi:hypothetical protein
MFKKILIVLSVVVVVVLAVSACRAYSPASNEGPLGDYNQIETVTTGDMVYLPVNMDGTASENIMYLNQAIDDWVKAHPEKKVICFQYVWMQEAFQSMEKAYTYGVSILTEDK